MDAEFYNAYVMKFDETAHSLLKENVILKAKVKVLEDKLLSLNNRTETEDGSTDDEG